MTTIENISLRA